MILPKSVQEVIETARIEEVVQDFVSLKRRGVNMIGLCPFHNEKTPSFTVSPSKNIYKCFGCGEAGNAVGFLMAHEQFSFPEAIKFLARKYGIEIEETEVTQEVREEQQLHDSLFIINQFAKDFFIDTLFNTDIGKSVGLNYFKERGFREESIKKFGLGFAPEKRDQLTLTAAHKGFNADLVKKLGLTTQYGNDFFRNRVIFPIHNLSGKVIGFGGRILQKDVKAPKYINSPETEIYNKRKVLYGIYFAKRAIRQLDECVLVEGYTDVLSLHQEGIENVVASSGTSLTEDQIRLIKRNTPNVKILFDGDIAGVKAALRGIDMLLDQGMNVKIVLVPEGEDPDSYLKSVGTTAFKEYLEKEAKDFILFKAALLMKEVGNDPVKRSHAIKDIVASIAKVQDPITRSLFVKECAGIVDLEERLIIDEANKVISTNYKKERQRIEARPEPGPFVDNIGEPPVILPDVESEKPVPVSRDAFQEKDIIRILIQHGDKIIDQEENISVAQFILSNIQDLLEAFDNGLYKKVIEVCIEFLEKDEKLEQKHFLIHPDKEISQLAINILATPYNYSENWANKWDIHLHSQKMPEENFKKDSSYSLQVFRLRKLDQLLSQNKEKIKAFSEAKDNDNVVVHMKVHQKLQTMREELTKKLGQVILGGKW